MALEKAAAEPRIVEVPNPYPEETVEKGTTGKTAAKKTSAKKIAAGTNSSKSATEKAAERIQKAVKSKSKTGKGTVRRKS